MITNFKIFENNRNLYKIGNIIKCSDFTVDGIGFVNNGYYEIIDLYYESDNFSDKFGEIGEGYKYDIKNLETDKEVWNIDENELNKNSKLATKKEYILFKNMKKFNL